jgi:nitrite reductase/ring-hydroxylating ferredoxin subunit
MHRARCQGGRRGNPLPSGPKPASAPAQHRSHGGASSICASAWKRNQVCASDLFVGLLRSAEVQRVTAIQELQRVVGPETIGRQEWLDGVSDQLQKGIATGITQAGAPAQALKDWLNGVWLVHAFVNVGALTCFTGSLLARRAGQRGPGVCLSTVGLSLASFSAWLGGDLVFALGNVVNRTAWEPEVGEFQTAARLDELPEGQLTAAQVKVEETSVQLVLLKRGSQVFALGNVCTHAGGPLAEGALVDGTCVQCPWHGSQFDMRDGRVVRGPATMVQPAYETRVRDGNVEVRLKREGDA